ncbi:MAG TPA: DUF4403 family protein [Polyangiaceae bacterium]|nr:DUF4403 family protein [Polyangiaceae bacterium]
MTAATRSLLLLFAAAIAACSRFGPVYPSRPNPSEGPALADPAPARVVAHIAISSAALRDAIEGAVPKTGDGTVHALGGDRAYHWERGPMDVAFSQGRIVLKTPITARVTIPLKTLELALDLRVEAEPVVSAQYAVKMQSIEVKVTSTEASLALADRVAGVYDRIADPIAAQIKDFAYDLRPVLAEAYARVAKPIEIPLGDASDVTACASLRVLEVEAGPTVLADGIEKDLALVVAPSITLPCVDTVQEERPALPPLSNVATLVPGPFTVTIPIAARYDELTRAMSAAFTDGKLFFSAEYPELYLEKPEIYESEGRLVLKLHLHGPVNKLGFDVVLDGDLYLVGHPTVIDNELTVPDLEPTIETKNFLLSLKAMTDGDRIRADARQALRLDIGQRIREARDKLGSGLTFEAGGGCFEGDVDTVEVTGVHFHAAYVRVYVAVTARARLTMPCAPGAAPGGTSTP